MNIVCSLKALRERAEVIDFSFKFKKAKELTFDPFNFTYIKIGIVYQYQCCEKNT